MSAARAQLGPGRWHFQHGPIDLVIGAEGEARAIGASLAESWLRFGQVMDELVAELPALREPVGERCGLRGPIARRMWAACAPYRPRFVTPMAAVAGSVAQEIAAFFDRAGVRRAWINNGGDIALVLAPGTRVGVAVCSQPQGARVARVLAGLPDRVDVAASSAVRGVATSGWGGRSLSLGIADAVTVLARTAAQADAAATMIANEVDCEHPAIERAPASALRDDSDLGERLATVRVGRLPVPAIDAALARGERFAGELVARGLVEQAMLSLQGRSRIVDASRARPEANDESNDRRVEHAK